MKSLFYLLLLMAILSSCRPDQTLYDASGTFEAVETLISAEASGKILQLNLEEGQELAAGQLIGAIDSTGLYLRKLQLEQNKKAVLSGKPRPQIQIKALQEQLATARTDRDRIIALVSGGVASPKQLDDANARVATLQAQLEAQQSTLHITNRSLDEQGGVLDVQLAETTDLLNKCRIVNPVHGTVLAKYAEPYEMTTTGHPLYKIADLSTLTLRAYITADQFAAIRLNQVVTVLTDDARGGYRSTTGTVSWISDQAEFTPKTILTKEARENLVYAIKVRVPNDGTYKIGMYGAVQFTRQK